MLLRCASSCSDLEMDVVIVVSVAVVQPLIKPSTLQPAFFVAQKQVG